ncbi:2-hydroxyacid dehydrogenase [Paenibacillus eucommiae]|uniref:Gluconate 2-dehydrogenase n=1 Tax=Paenibacillus eucommiae TaxID=1355755 RepID=A0ABS4IT18_9BACL|nr:D-glycerate dehydrogenase [Paenibacillus eucommiae]MBP1990280.1 gluconate 2-dehydrogenase [Paenibacillus eucommiae]
MKPVVFIDRVIPAEVEAYIAEHCDYSRWDRPERMSRELLLEKLANVDGLLTGGAKIDNELLEHAPKLKVVSSMSVGYNHYDTAAMKARGVMGTNSPYVLDETVADLAFALILGTARRTSELAEYVKAGKWQADDNEVLYGVDVHHATLGIIGLGRIGEAIARRGKFGFGMNVLYHNRSRKQAVEDELGVSYRSLDELLSTADFIVLMTPLTPETTRLIGRREFELMKPSATFINVSRGQTVDEEALIEALQNKKIRAAGLDVFNQEPADPGNPLLQLPNVLALPHIGSATAQTRFDMAMLAAKNLVSAVTGHVPPNLVEELK